MKISRESIIIAGIGIADLITTLLWVNHHGAQEANPLFRFYLAMGAAWFALMKIVMLAAPILLLEWARSHRPVFTRIASRCAIVGYLGIYVVGVMHLNPNLLKPNSGWMVASGVELMDPEPIYLSPSGNSKWLDENKSSHSSRTGMPIATLSAPAEY